MIDISLKFVLKGQINNILALVQIMAQCQTGNEPLSEPMLTQFNDVYMQHQVNVAIFFIARQNDYQIVSLNLYEEHSLKNKIVSFTRKEVGLANILSTLEQ